MLNGGVAPSGAITQAAIRAMGINVGLVDTTVVGGGADYTS